MGCPLRVIPSQCTSLEEFVRNNIPRNKTISNGGNDPCVMENQEERPPFLWVCLITQEWFPTSSGKKETASAPAKSLQDTCNGLAGPGTISWFHHYERIKNLIGSNTNRMKSEPVDIRGTTLTVGNDYSRKLDLTPKDTTMVPSRVKSHFRE